MLRLSNLGNFAAVGSVDLSLYAPADRALDPADQTLATIADRPIRVAAGKSRRVRLSFRDGPGIPPGSYFLIATVAPHVVPADTDPADDTITSPMAINLVA